MVDLWSRSLGDDEDLMKGGTLAKVEPWSQSTGDDEALVKMKLWSQTSGDDKALVKRELWSRRSGDDEALVAGFAAVGGSITWERSHRYWREKPSSERWPTFSSGGGRAMTALGKK